MLLYGKRNGKTDRNTDRQMAKQTDSWMLVLLCAFALTLEFLMLKVYQHPPFAEFVETEIEIIVK